MRGVSGADKADALDQNPGRSQGMKLGQTRQDADGQAQEKKKSGCC